MQNLPILNHLGDPINLSPFSLNSDQLENLTPVQKDMTFCYFHLFLKNETSYEFHVIDFLLLITQRRIWHALQPYRRMLTILLPCSFTLLLWPPCTWLILVSTLGVFIRPQWIARYPQSFLYFHSAGWSSLPPRYIQWQAFCTNLELCRWRNLMVPLTKGKAMTLSVTLS